MNLAMYLPLLAQTVSTTGSPSTRSGTAWMIVLLLFFVLYMWWISRRDKKRKGEEDAMRDNMKIGDEVLTVGGVMGRIVAVKDDSVIVETGADRNKIRFTKTAISNNISADNRVKEAKAAKEAAKKAEKEKKKAEKNAAKK